jgi:hypothetical protein
MAGVIVQPMITGGVEVTISVLEEQMFGPLVLFGAAGAADVLADRAARLAPLTDADADELIRSGRAAPLLLDRRGAPGADRDVAPEHAGPKVPADRPRPPWPAGPGPAGPEVTSLAALLPEGRIR